MKKWLSPERVQKAFHEQTLDLFFPPSALSSLLRFTVRMLEINRTLNLTKWTSDEDVLTFHLLDSAVCVPLIQDLSGKQPQKWIDLGSGCGFPGALLIAAFPDFEVTLLDSVGKKVKALRECLAAAGWKASALQARAEELGRNPETRETWDGVTARGVAALPLLLEYSLPLLKIGGYLVNWMTEEQAAEVDKLQGTLKGLQAQIVKTKTYSFPGMSQSRVLLVVEKMGKTPASTPRRQGKGAPKSP